MPYLILSGFYELYFLMFDFYLCILNVININFFVSSIFHESFYFVIYDNSFTLEFMLINKIE